MVRQLKRCDERLLTPMLCQDGSFTYFRHDLNEAYHPPAGGVMEAYEKYVYPCGIPALAKKGTLRVLDIGFGMGFMAAAAIDTALAENPSCRVIVVGLERDEAIVRLGQELPFPFRCAPLFDALRSSYDRRAKRFSIDDGTVRLEVLIGDARRRLVETGLFDAIFFDPFSPKKAPHLWTAPFFREVRAHCAADAALATYSCSRPVRDRLAEAGFSVHDGPVRGRRGPSTVAVALPLPSPGTTFKKRG